MILQVLHLVLFMKSLVYGLVALAISLLIEIIGRMFTNTSP